MSRFIIELKQQTPLKHFQYDCPGATLRASEVKPRLDKFLIEEVFNEKYEDFKRYLIGYKDGKTKEEFQGEFSFNYKLRIKNVKNLRPINGKKKQKYKCIWCNPLELDFFSFKKGILEIIKENLSQFLADNNFGNSQSKGLGSFCINDEKKYIFNGKYETYN